MSKKVYVRNMRGEPLMPTSPAKARHLLDDDRAEVVERKPFTIRLKYPTGENRQEVTLGVDAGYSTVGFSAVTENEELIRGELDLRTDVSDRLRRRKDYRRNRRSRKTRYRKPRFDNRRREDGWLAPSIRHRMNDHLRLVEMIGGLLPVTRTVVEVATFDTEKLANPELDGTEYVPDTFKGYEVKEYLLAKWGRRCAYCGAEDEPLEVDHIIPKSRGGSDRVDNLAISCVDCNREKGDRTAEEFGHPEVQRKAGESLKEAAFMNTVCWKIVNELDCDYTYGYRTKKKRIDLGLEKSDDNDAFVIAGDGDQKRIGPYRVTRGRRNNRKLEINRKGHGRSVRRERYEFQPGDLARKDDTLYRARGSCSYGRYVRAFDEEGNEEYLRADSLELVKYSSGLSWREGTCCNSSPTESENSEGVSLQQSGEKR